MPFIAQYTIRSKQSYIFRTNAMREITGASALISGVWGMLFDAAENAGLKVKRLDNNSPDFPKDPADAFRDGQNMVDLFRGGGNDTVLFKDRRCFELANRAFSRKIMMECPGMVPLAVGVETGHNYIADYSALMKKLDTEKNRMVMADSNAMLPFSLMDRKTFQPITNNLNGEELSAESYAKRKYFNSNEINDPAVSDLDKLITMENKSLLAVIHADGNNMGVKIQRLLNGKTGYDECIPLMRQFTEDTSRVFSYEGAEFPERALMRWIVNDGDDATVVCEAKDAEAIAEAYLKKVSGSASLDGKFSYSSCAGICIFHSHFPFSSAYALAEDACASAKKKAHPEDGSVPEVAWIDYHFIHRGVGGDLESIRSEHGTADRMARPLGVICDENEHFTVDNMRALYSALNRHGVTKTNIKAISLEWERSTGDGMNELRRIFFRAPDLKGELLRIFDTETDILKAIYDISEVIDIEWFKDSGKG